MNGTYSRFNLLDYLTAQLTSAAHKLLYVPSPVCMVVLEEGEALILVVLLYTIVSGWLLGFWPAAWSASAGQVPLLYGNTTPNPGAEKTQECKYVWNSRTQIRPEPKNAIIPRPGNGDGPKHVNCTLSPL